MKNIVLRRIVAVLALAAFAYAMAMLDFVSSVVTRGLLAGLAGGSLCIAYVYSSRWGAYQRTVRQRVVMVLGALGYAVAMTARGELSSIYTRVLLGGVAGGFMGIVALHAFRRRDRQ